jgi:hypothetical protein
MQRTELRTCQSTPLGDESVSTASAHASAIQRQDPDTPRTILHRRGRHAEHVEISAAIGMQNEVRAKLRQLTNRRIY